MSAVSILNRTAHECRIHVNRATIGFHAAILIGICWCLIGCDTAQRSQVSGFTIQDWSLIGPLFVPPDEDPYRYDAASFVGLTEEDLVNKGMEVAIEQAPVDSVIAQGREFFQKSVAGQTFVDFYFEYQMQASRDDVQPVAYAESIIASESEKSVYLLIASAAGPVVWVNGQRVYEKPVSRSLFPYDEAILIQLRKGRNRLLFKVPRLRHQWGLTARVEPTIDSATATALAAQESRQSFLWPTAVIAPGQALELKPRGVPAGAVLDFQVTSLEGNVIESFSRAVGESWSVPNDLAPNLYRTSVTIGEREHHEWLCIGDLDTIGRESLAHARTESIQVDENGDALVRRIEIMLEPENRSRSSGGKQWLADRNLIHSLVQLDRVLADARRYENPFAHAPGLQIRGFSSQTDGQRQTYRLFVPPNYRRESPKAFPLVVLLPARTYVPRPFIRSIYMEEITEADRLCALAAKEGVILLWSGFRNQLGRQPCEVTHLEEVLADVEKHYRIDPNRVSLLAGCSGGGLAIDAVAALPQRFCAVGLMNPLFGFKREFPSAHEFGSHDAFLSWQKSVDGVDRLWRSGGPAFRIVHDGGEPGHGHLSVSMRFEETARRHDYPVQFDRFPQTVSEHFGAWKELIGWLRRQERHPSDPASDLRAPGHLKKLTVFNALAERFTVIYGTDGSPRENAEMKRLAEEFRDSWQEMHYGDCRVLSDESTRLDVEENLIVIGDGHTNRIAKQLGLMAGSSPETITIGDSEWSGEALSVQVVLSHPKYPTRKIVLVTGTDLVAVSLENPALPMEGWFRYAVWQGRGEDRRLIAAGQ